MPKNLLLIPVAILLFAAAKLESKLATTEPKHKLIAPLPANLDVDNLMECTVPASFTADDFRWMGGNLRMTVYNPDLYDAMEISQLQKGDTLVYAAIPVVVKKIERLDNSIEINGGLDNGGPWLVGNGGGTFIAKTWDDHSVYSELGKCEMALDDFVLIDCGQNPEDPVDTIRTNKKAYIEKLTGSRREFSHLSTRVTINSDGMISEIKRNWIP